MTREELIARLEGGEAGREIEGYIAVALGWQHIELGHDLVGVLPVKWMDFGDGGHWTAPGDHRDGLAPRDEAFMEKHTFPEVTTSLDAALALVERVKPKAWIEINGPRKYLNIPTPVPNYWKAVVAPWEDKTESVGWAATPAAALIAALLKAEG
jgi:hypothetical protein